MKFFFKLPKTSHIIAAKLGISIVFSIGFIGDTLNQSFWLSLSLSLYLPSVWLFRLEREDNFAHTNLIRIHIYKDERPNELRSHKDFMIKCSAADSKLLSTIKAQKSGSHFHRPKVGVCTRLATYECVCSQMKHVKNFYPT